MLKFTQNKNFIIIYNYVMLLLNRYSDVINFYSTYLKNTFHLFSFNFYIFNISSYSDLYWFCTLEKNNLYTSYRIYK